MQPLFHVNVGGNCLQHNCMRSAKPEPPGEVLLRADF
jgi:hypothetical protein